MSASSLSVVATTLACASAMTRALLRRTPLICSGWPLAATDGGWVRMGLPLAESWFRWAASRVGAAAVAGFAAEAVAPGGAPRSGERRVGEEGVKKCRTQRGCYI